MPTITVYRQQVTPDRAPDTRLGVQATANDFGAPIAAGIQDVASSVSRASQVYDQVAAQERVKANQAQEAKWTAAGVDLANNLTLELKSNKLNAAVEQAPKFEERYKKGLDEIGAKLGNDEQRAAFSQWRARQEISFQSAVRNYAFDEGEKSYDIDHSNAKDALARAIRNNADPSNGEEGIRQVQDTLNQSYQLNAALGARRGLNDAQIAELNRRDNADAQAVVISAYNEAGYSIKAKEYFDAHKDELEPKARDMLGRALEIGVTKAEGQQQAAAIYSPDKTLEDMFSEADKIKDQQVQAEVKRRLEEKDSLRKRAIQQVQDKTFEDSYQKVKDSPLGFDALTPGERAAMGADREEKLKQWTLRRSRGEKLPWQQSKSARYDLEQIASNPATRDKFLNMKLPDIAHLVNEDDYNALDSLQKDMKNGGSDSTFLTTKNEMVSQALASIKIDPRPYHVSPSGTVTYNEQAVNFIASVESDAANIASASGRTKANKDDVQKAIDENMKRKVYVSEWGRDPQVVASTLTSERLGNSYVPIDQIDAGKVQAIRDLIIRSGGTPTDDRVQRAYAARLANNRAILEQILKEK